MVETDVHYPTDISLLWDAIRKIITLIAVECFSLGITEWRQSDYILRKIKKAFNLARKLKRSNAKSEERKAKQEQLIIQAHQQYIDLVRSYVERAKFSLAFLKQCGSGNIAKIMEIENFIVHAERQIDQIFRRVIKGKKIPHSEKVFSIFEEHTEWITKGKAGVPQELGVKVCILEDQFGFILHHHVKVDQTDDQVAVEMVADTREKYNGLTSCSFDKGFHSQKNQLELKPLLDQVVLHRKGRLSKQAQQIENSANFIHSRRKHSAVESGINALENHGLDRCPDHGLHGFRRYVGLAVLSRNIQKLGAMLQQQTIKKMQRRKKAADQEFHLAA